MAQVWGRVYAARGAEGGVGGMRAQLCCVARKLHHHLPGTAPELGCHAFTQLPLPPSPQAVRLLKELKDRGQDSEEVHSALVEAFCRWADCVLFHSAGGVSW